MCVNIARRFRAYNHSHRIPCAGDNIYMRSQSSAVVLADLVDSPFAAAAGTVVDTFAVERAVRDIGLGAEVEVSAWRGLERQPVRWVVSDVANSGQHRLHQVLDRSRPS